MALPEEREEQLSVGGFQGIKKIRGLLVDIDVQDPPASWENREKQVVVVKLEDATVLEMLGDEELFELKDRKFNFLVPYVEAGKKPHQNSIYAKCWLASAKELGHIPSEFIGSYVTLEKQPRLLFQRPIIDPATKKAKLDEDGKKVLEDILAVDQQGRPNHFCFVSDEATSSGDVNGYIRNLLAGANQTAALRRLILDVKAKQYPEYKVALNNGTLAGMLDLMLVGDGDEAVFQKIEEYEETVEEAVEED